MQHLDKAPKSSSTIEKQFSSNSNPSQQPQVNPIGLSAVQNRSPLPGLQKRSLPSPQTLLQSLSGEGAGLGAPDGAAMQQSSTSPKSSIRATQSSL